MLEIPKIIRENTKKKIIRRTEFKEKFGVLKDIPKIKAEKKKILYGSQEKRETIKKTRIETLFLKYFPKEITGRGDIGIYPLYIAYENGDITKEDMNKIIEYAYKVAYEKELKTFAGKTGEKNLLKYKEIGKKTFDSVLMWIIPDKTTRENLFLLSWVESSCNPKKELNKYGIGGFFQLDFNIAKEYGAEKVEDLYNFEKSAFYSASYLRDLISEELDLNPGFKVEDAIEMAMIRYNGNFKDRLLAKYRKNFTKTIFDIYVNLTFIDKKNLAVKQKLKKLEEVHNKFFVHSGDGNGVFSGNSHFSILERKDRENITNKDISDWIAKYTNNILMQQNKYARKYFAAVEVFKDKIS